MNRRNLLKSIASLGVLGIIPSQLKAEEKVLDGWDHTKIYRNGKVWINKIEVDIQDRCPAKEIVFQGERFGLSSIHAFINPEGEDVGVGAFYYTEETKNNGWVFEDITEYINSINEGDLIDLSKVYRRFKR